MYLRYTLAVAAIAVPLCVAATGVQAANATQLQSVLTEFHALKQAYETRIKSLETKIQKLEQTEKRKKTAAKSSAKPAAPSSSGRSIKDNSFNPSIGVILNGRVSSFSRSASEIAGFGVGDLAAILLDGGRQRGQFGTQGVELAQ